MAQWPAEAIQNGRTHQIAGDFQWLAGEDLAEKIFHHILCIHLRGEQVGFQTPLAAYGKDCQQQAGHPAFRFFRQCGGRGWLNLGSQHPGQEILYFRLAEAQVLGAYLGQKPPGAQRGNRQVGITPANQHEMQRLRRMAQQFADQIKNGFILDQVKIIQRQNERLLDPVDLADEAAGQNRYRRKA